MKEIDNPCLKELIDELPGTVLQAEANSTVKCYSSSWQRWKRWSMEKLGKCELPANPMHVALYLQDLIRTLRKKVSLQRLYHQQYMVLTGPIRLH